MFNIFPCSKVVVFGIDKSSLRIPRCLVENYPVLVQAIDWHRTGDKPLPESMINQFVDAYDDGDDNDKWSNQIKCINR